MLERDIQKMLFQWAKLSEAKYPQLKLLYASMNGVRLTSALAGKRAKEQGLKRGIPDIMLPYPNKLYHGLFIELKSEKGRISKDQKIWIKQLNEAGYLAMVCYGFDKAKQLIIAYLTF